jgi:hypothetical protein
VTLNDFQTYLTERHLVLVRHGYFADGVTFIGLYEYLKRRQLVMVRHSRLLFVDGVTLIGF